AACRRRRLLPDGRADPRAVAARGTGARRRHGQCPARLLRRRARPQHPLRGRGGASAGHGGGRRRTGPEIGRARRLGRHAGLFRGQRRQSLGSRAQSRLPYRRGRAYLAAGMNHDAYDDAYISAILDEVKTVAIVGASANEVRPSFFVTKYLIDKGYTVFPINPGHAGKEILGRTAYARLADVPEPVDMVDIFRASSAVPAIVDEALALDPLPKVI